MNSQFCPHSDIHVCLPSQFKCSRPSRCIPGILRCNGQNNCGQGEDEKDCRKSSPISLINSKIECFDIYIMHEAVF